MSIQTWNRALTADEIQRIIHGQGPPIPDRESFLARCCPEPVESYEAFEPATFHGLPWGVRFHPRTVLNGRPLSTFPSFELVRFLMIKIRFVFRDETGLPAGDKHNHGLTKFPPPTKSLFVNRYPT